MDLVIKVNIFQTSNFENKIILCDVFKVYFKDQNPKFPEGGKLTQYLEKMEIGDTIDVRGPSGRLIYHGRGDFEIKAVKRKDPSQNLYAKKLSMIAGKLLIF